MLSPRHVHYQRWTVYQRPGIVIENTEDIGMLCYDTKEGNVPSITGNTIMTDTQNRIDAILDELGMTTGIEEQVKIMSGESLSVLGHAIVNHTFGDIDSLSTHFPHDHQDIEKEVSAILNGEDGYDFSLDLDVLNIMEIGNREVFFLPVQEGMTTAILAIISIGGEFVPDDLEKTLAKNVSSDRETHQGFDQGKVNNLVKMVNSGEDIGEFVEGLDNDEIDDEVLSFRGF